MLARFFIDRPILAWVISILIILAGLVAGVTLPIAQYPEITPPAVQVTAYYPGASSKVVAETIGAPIEQQVNGVEDMLYMSSQSTNDGAYNLTVTFQVGTDLNTAQVLVQNRVSQAIPSLPETVKLTGVSVKKRSSSILLVINLFSETNSATQQPTYDQLYLSNYAQIRLRDALARVTGVGDISMLGQQDYAMRVWLDQQKLAAKGLTASDVVAAVKEQNIQVAAGQIGQQPSPETLEFQLPLTTLGRLARAEEFGRIVVKTGKPASNGTSAPIVRLSDVARIELGAKNQDTRCYLDGTPSVGLAVYTIPGANALEVAKSVRRKMSELAKTFPNDLRYRIVYDTTPFITESVAEVFKTLRDAVILVALVTFLFLQDWRATLLPMIGVAVSLIGTLLVLAATGYTLNNLTLFGLVLAIGIVVDDAIVVLENIERWLAKGLPVREATLKAMSEITGPIIAITLVLSSVFLPSMFLSGITGQFYRQFAITISASMLLSAISAMTLTPAVAGMIFSGRDAHGGGHGEGHAGGHGNSQALPRPGIALLLALLGWWAARAWLAGGGADHSELEGHSTDSTTSLLGQWGPLATGAILAIAGWALSGPINRWIRAFFTAFNHFFDRTANGYGTIVRWILRLAPIVLLAYLGLLGVTYWGLTKIPTGFIPTQDKGYLVADIRLPDAASLPRTQAVLRDVEKIISQTPGVAHVISVPGQSFILSAIGSNLCGLFVILDPFHERMAPELKARYLERRLKAQLNREIPDALVSVYNAPPIDGLGSAGGFKLMVQDQSDIGLRPLTDAADQLAKEGTSRPEILGMVNSFRATSPQWFVDVNREKCKAMGLPLQEVFSALQIYLGSNYVNDFNRFGRTWQVILQNEGKYRSSIEDVKQIQVRSQTGAMIPLGSVVDIQPAAGPILVTRYNMFPSATINGAAFPTVSSGQAMEVVEEVAKQTLPAGFGYEWTELSLLEKESSRLETLADWLGNPIAAFAGACILVFFVLAGQYESWSVPFAVILVVPMCIFSALIGIFLARMDLNIFVQIGFVVLVGLACKNAILIVEFAREKVRAGEPILEATVDACKLRLRPIVMTSFAFILGVVPLVLAEGAGAEMRKTLGVAVLSGMLGVTIFGIFLTPLFYYLIGRWTDRSKSSSH